MYLQWQFFRYGNPPNKIPHVLFQFRQMHDRLLSDTHADPLAAIASFDEDSTVADQLKAFYNKFVQLK